LNTDKRWKFETALISTKSGIPFDLDLIFGPDGIEKFDDARNRRVDVEGNPPPLAVVSGLVEEATVNCLPT
jgi:hypothetical protein